MDIFVAVDNECTFLSRNFSVYITISVESAQEQAERSLKRCRYELERRGMKVSKSKIEYTSVNERETGEKVTK